MIATDPRRLELLRDRHSHLSTLPIASVMVCSLLCYRWALMSVAVSFVHTVKTLGPVFTIAFSRLLLNERLPTAHYLSVIIVLDHAVATAHRCVVTCHRLA